MENDDKIIRQFMHAHKHEIEDNGFSRRVIRRLPERGKRMPDVLTAVCTVLCCILFYVFNGFGFLLRAVTEIIASQSLHLAANANLPALLIAAGVLAIVGIQKACSIR